jgi:GntR family transcriptional regulator, transcriptional repressor for pyruvate dehydrogenase complex
MLVEAVTQAQSVLSELLAAIPVLRANIGHCDPQHAALVEAVLAGDGARSRPPDEETR